MVGGHAPAAGARRSGAGQRRAPLSTDQLGQLGLRAGETIRFRGRGRRWQSGTVARLERDGSIGITDGKGAARAMPVERVEVRCTGRRGSNGWEPLSARADRTEQLRLL